MAIKTLLKHFWCCQRPRGGVAQSDRRDAICLQQFTTAVNTMSWKVQDEQQPNLAIKVSCIFPRQKQWRAGNEGGLREACSISAEWPSLLNLLKPFKMHSLHSDVLKGRWGGKNHAGRTFKVLTSGWITFAAFTRIIVTLSASLLWPRDAFTSRGEERGFYLFNITATSLHTNIRTFGEILAQHPTTNTPIPSCYLLCNTSNVMQRVQKDRYRAKVLESTQIQWSSRRRKETMKEV